MNKSLSICVLLIGIVLVLFGLLLSTPSQRITTPDYYDPSEEKVFQFGKTESYSNGERYVGGDAYNYIIASSIVGSRLTGSMVSKVLLISIGVLTSCIGLIGIEKANNMEKILEELKSLKRKVE